MVVQPRLSSKTTRVSIVTRHLGYRNYHHYHHRNAKTVCSRLMSKECIKSIYGFNADLVLDRVLSSSALKDGRVGDLYNGDIASIVFRRVGGKKTIRGFSTRPVAAQLAYAFANSVEKEWNNIASILIQVQINDHTMEDLIEAIAEEIAQIYTHNPTLKFHAMHLCDKWPVSEDAVGAKMRALAIRR